MHSHKRTPQTLEQKLGFQDEDRKNSQHDDIVLWVTQNADYCLDEIHGRTDKWPQKTINKINQRAAEIQEYLTSEHNKATGRLSLAQQKLSNTEVDGPGFKFSYGEEKQGFKFSYGEEKQVDSAKSDIDRIISWQLEFQALLQNPQIPRPFRKITSIALEVPVTKRGGYIVGFMDVVITWETGILWSPRYKRLPPDKGWRSALWQVDIEHYRTNIEVKTKVASFGDLLRQLNLYRECSERSNEHYAVVTPDGRFRDILKTQGIALVLPG